MQVLPAAPAGPPAERLEAQQVWNALLRNRWLLAGVMGAVLGLTALLTYLARPVYEAAATVRVENSRGDKNPLAELSPFAGNVPGQIETDQLVLRSRDVAQRVVDTLGLRVGLLKPEVPRSQVLRLLNVPRSATSGTFELEHVSGSRYRLRVLGRPPHPPASRDVEIGQPFKVADVVLALDPRLLREPPERIRFVLSPFLVTAEGLRSQIGVARPDPMARIVSISHRSPDPELAAAVPNAVTSAFIQHKLEGSRQESRSTVLFLRDQVAIYEGELARAETSLRGFRERERVVMPQEEATGQVQRLAELRAEMDQLRSERQSLAGLLERVQSAPREPGEAMPYRQLAAFPTFLGNRAVQDIMLTLISLENQRSELMVRRTSESVDVQGIDRRIRELELQLYQMSRNYLESLDSKIASNQAILSRFGSQLELIPAREVEFARLARQQKLLEDIYTLLQTRLKEAEIRDAVTPADVRLIDAALVPTMPVSPRPMRNLFIGTILGLLLGVAAALARTLLDYRVRTTDDVKAATAMPILGVIPRDHEMLRAAAGRGLRRIRKVPPEVFVSPARVSMQADPNSPVAEAFRLLRTNMAFSRVGGPPQLILVTSAMPGDGKSTSASNLALALAQQGTRTLLVDADLRRGTLHRLLGVPQEPGLTNLLLGRVSLQEVVHRVPTGVEPATLDLLTAGVFPPNPAELLASPATAELFQRLRGEYEAIVVDAPPLNPVADAAVLAHLADATVLVTRPGFTDRRALHHAAAQLHQVRAPVSGVVVNDVDFSDRASGYHGGGYGYPSNGDGRSGGRAAAALASANGRKA